MFCKECGVQISDKAAICVKCGVPTDLGQAAQSAQSNEALRILLPVGRSGYAIAAGYLALFSILVVPAPFAVLFGVLALRDIKKHPEKGGSGRAYFAIIAGLVVPTVVIIWGMSLPK